MCSTIQNFENICTMVPGTNSLLTLFWVKYEISFVKKFVSCFILLPWSAIFSGFRFYFFYKRSKLAEILHEDYYSQMQMIYFFRSNVTATLPHLATLCHTLPHFVKLWHTLPQLATPCHP